MDDIQDVSARTVGANVDLLAQSGEGAPASPLATGLMVTSISQRKIVPKRGVVRVV